MAYVLGVLYALVKLPRFTTTDQNRSQLAQA